MTERHGGRRDETTSRHEDDWDDQDIGDDYYDCGDYAEDDYVPEFGCACENAIIVDTTCDGCIAAMAEQVATE